jgi:hypothetical protein
MMVVQIVINTAADSAEMARRDYERSQVNSNWFWVLFLEDWLEE